MARRKTLIDLLDQMAPETRKAFLESVANIRSDFQFSAFKAAYEARDVEGVLSVLNLGSEYYAPLDRAIEAAYLAGGGFAFEEVKQLARRAKANTIIGRFDGRNLRAERQIRAFSADRVVEISGETRQMVRERLTRNMIEGVNPQRAARELVGVIPKGSRNRRGGIIGLDPHRTAQADRVREILSSPDQIADYFIGTKPRFKSTDRRFDGLVHRAIKERRSLSQADIEKISQRHTSRLLYQRGETIARTELLGSMHAAKEEGLRQMIDGGRFRADAVTQEWDASNDATTRPSHAAMDGQERKLGEPFVSGDGNQLRFPGDPDAPAYERINCRCVLRTKIDFFADL